MTNDIYLNCKAQIKKEAILLKRDNPKDKAYIRYQLNTLCDQLIKQINWYAMKDKITEKQAKLYALWLSSFTADIHPKN
jgi:hypothetical protein